MGATTVSVLGPVAACVDGRHVDLGGRRQQALLGALAAARGRPVGVARLQEELWGPAEAPGSAKTLSVYVSRLRKALGDVVQLEPGGYRLSADVDVDAALVLEALDDARELLATGRTEQALRRAAAALERWRGEPYADLSGPVAVREQARLAEVRTTLLAQQGEALLALGRSEDVVLVLRGERDVADVDRLSVLLAVALHRSGRPLEALEAVRTRRDRLLDSGLDPSPELLALEQDLLARADHLEPVVPAQRAPSTARAPQRAARPPAPMSSYVGRAADLAAARSALASARLVTLVGTGGVGKTRTALEVLRDVPGRAPGAVAWLALAEHADGSLLDAAAAAALGVTPNDGTPPLAAVADALGDEAVLLVVDNCEHLVADVARLVARLLAACGGLRVLATSRERLGIPGEVAVDLAPLPVQEPDGTDGAAVALFLERAGGAVRDEHDLRAVRQVCAALDGLPLAVELAAARVPALAVQDVAAALEDRFALLTSRAGVLEHHRSLHAAIDWSYRLLPPPVQQCLRLLAAFDGGFELDAASALLGAPAAVPVSELVVRSLLEVDDSVRPRRHRMLASVRAFAVQQAGPDERRDAERRHAAWAAATVRTAAAGILDGDRGPAAMARLDAERPNLRAAVANAAAHGDVGTALRMTGDLGYFWYRRGLVQEGLALLDLALRAADPHDPATAWPLHARVHLQQLGGDTAGALVTAERAHALLERVDDERVAARVQATLSWAQTAAGRLADAREHAERAVQRAQRCGSDVLVSEALLCRAAAAAAADRPDAGRLALEANERARAARHDWAAGTAVWIAATCAQREGSHRLAAARASAAVEHGARGSDTVLLLRGALVLAAALTHLDEAAVGARLLGAITTTCSRTALRVERYPQDLDDVLGSLREALGPDRAAREYATGASWDTVQLVTAVRALAVRLRLREEPCACAAGGPGVLLLMPTVRTAHAPTG